MQNPNLATTQAFDGVIGDVALEIGVSDKRIYEILGRDNPYVKTWRLLNALGRIAPERLELIRADFNARCDRIVGSTREPVTVAEMNRECDEPVQARLDKRPRDEERRELQQAAAVINRRLSEIDAMDDAIQRTVVKFAS